MISLPAGAGAPASGSYLWPVPGFGGSVSCATELTLDGHVALGPAITFGPAATRFPREVPLTIPINPALLPAGARARHLVVAYAGPAAASPRPSQARRSSRWAGSGRSRSWRRAWAPTRRSWLTDRVPRPSRER
jgi:hypothetical protein